MDEEKGFTNLGYGRSLYLNLARVANEVSLDWPLDFNVGYKQFLKLKHN
jgi:hypothetical protein